MLSERLMNFSLFYVQEPFANRSSAWFIRKVAESWFSSDSCILRVDMLQINRAGIYISHFCEHQDQFTRRTDGPADRRSDALNTAVQTSAAVSIKDLKVVVKSRTGLKRRSTTTNNL